MSCQPALSDWYFVSETDYDYLFIDTETLSIDGNFRTIWGGSELKDNQGDQKSKSSRYLKEYNCSKIQERILTLTIFSDKGAQGDAIGTKNFGAWRQVLKNTAANDVLKFVCLMQ